MLFCVGLAPLFPTARAEEAGANDNEIDDTGGDRSNRSQSCRGRDCKSKRRLEDFGSDSDDGGRVQRRKTTKKGGNNSGGGCCTESGLPDAIADIYGNLILGVSRNPSLEERLQYLALEGVWLAMASTKPAGEERVRAFVQAMEDTVEMGIYPSR